MEFREIEIPGDKSISHRAIMLSALSRGTVEIDNLLFSEDVLRTVDCFRKMGVRIDLYEEKKKAIVYGVGLRGLKQPKEELYCGNSGTTMRLMAGILVGQDFDSVLSGDESLSTRPMKRIIEPLSLMGGSIRSKTKDCPPLYIKGGSRLVSIDYDMKVSSAQVKSAILLADLYTESRNSKVREKNITRDHTERMLKYFLSQDFKLDKILIPGDISSASYFIVKAMLDDNYSIVIKNLGLNKTRTGILDILTGIGGNIRIKNIRTWNNEEFGDLYVKKSKLRPFKIDGEIMGRLIDELPILAVLASFIDGVSIVRGAGELRVKETDRINAICRNLEKFAVDLEELEDGFIINGGKRLQPARVESFKDHRIYMSFEIMASLIPGSSKVEGRETIGVSFPDFYRELYK